MADFDVVIEKLHSFETADELAEFFQGYGIKAQPKKARSCAITKFVMEETGLEDVLTTGSHVSVLRRDVLTMDVLIEAKENNTPAMAHFVYKFDTNQYPDLVEPGEDGSKWGLAD